MTIDPDLAAEWSGEALELAAAIRDALAVPVADGREPGAALAEEWLLAKRAALVRGVLGKLIAVGGTTARDLAGTARTIRGVTADTPVTYAVSQSAEVPS